MINIHHRWCKRFSRCTCDCSPLQYLLYDSDHRLAGKQIFSGVALFLQGIRLSSRIFFYFAALVPSSTFTSLLGPTAKKLPPCASLGMDGVFVVMCDVWRLPVSWNKEKKHHVEGCSLWQWTLHIRGGGVSILNIYNIDTKVSINIDWYSVKSIDTLAELLLLSAPVCSVTRQSSSLLPLPLWF